MSTYIVCMYMYIYVHILHNHKYHFIAHNIFLVFTHIDKGHLNLDGDRFGLGLLVLPLGPLHCEHRIHGRQSLGKLSGKAACLISVRSRERQLALAPVVCLGVAVI